MRWLKQVFYMLSRMLQKGKNALFWSAIALAVGVKIAVLREHAIAMSQ